MLLPHKQRKRTACCKKGISQQAKYSVAYTRWWMLRLACYTRLSYATRIKFGKHWKFKLSNRQPDAVHWNTSAERQWHTSLMRQVILGEWVISKFNGTLTPKGSYHAKTGDNDCNVISNGYSLRTALCESIRYQAKSEQDVRQDQIPRVRHGEAALCTPQVILVFVPATRPDHLYMAQHERWVRCLTQNF